MNRNLAFLNSFVNVSEDTFSKLQKISTFKEIEATTIITNEGEIPEKVYMLVQGIMHAYINSESGKQYNKKIFSPNSFVGALTAMIKNKPSKLTYQALTKCKVFEVDFNKFMNLCKTDVNISNLYIKILERIFMQYERRSIELISLDATQRYIKLRQRIPNIDDLIPQFQIASFLGITPVQLSRIRKKMNGSLIS